MTNNKKRSRDYSEYKSPHKGEFVERKCLKCDKKVKLRAQYRLCTRCRSAQDPNMVEDHRILF